MLAMRMEGFSSLMFEQNSEDIYIYMYRQAFYKERSKDGSWGGPDHIYIYIYTPILTHQNRSLKMFGGAPFEIAKTGSHVRSSAETRTMRLTKLLISPRGCVPELHDQSGRGIPQPEF